MKQLQDQGKSNHLLSGWKYSKGTRLLLFFCFFLLFYVTLSGHLISKTYDIELGGTAETTITAPKQVEDIDATQLARDRAEKKVQPVYSTVSLKNADLVRLLYNKLESINFDDSITPEEKAVVYRKEFNAIYDEFMNDFVKSGKNNGDYSKALADEMVSKLTEQEYRIPEEAFFKLTKLTANELTEMESVTISIVNQLMNDQITSAPTARAKVAELVNASSLTKRNMRELVQEIVRFAITPNRFYDADATQGARAEARENTKTVYIEKNQVIVEKGQKITESVYKQLDSLGMLNKSNSYWPILGLVLFVLLLLLCLHMFIRQSELPIKTNNAHLLMLLMIVALDIIGMKIVALGQSLDYPFIGFLAPIAMGSMLIAVLLDAGLAFVVSILFGLLSSAIYNVEPGQLFEMKYAVMALIVCFASIFAIHRASQRSAILKAGIIVSFFGCLAVTAFYMLEPGAAAKQIVLSLSFAFAAGLLTAVFVIGLLPFFEVAFGILSPLKLVELSNPNHPLLRKLLTETPGTYHHSIMVGNLSEAAAESIGANGLLCRVGSFYHDIGKTKRPNYFIENQHSDNPHDHIDPKLSKSIIVAHARDGVEMLKEYKIPKPICDIAEQHHGTTLLQFFYHKAKKQTEKEGKDPAEVTEAEYRYPGPKAQTKEAAIVGIADCVEAAVRSLRNPTIEQIDTMIRKIIKSRLDDNQFNECDLTLKELDTIAKTLKEALLGIFHSRIEYPDDLKQNEEGDKSK